MVRRHCPADTFQATREYYRVYVVNQKLQINVQSYESFNGCWLLGVL